MNSKVCLISTANSSKNLNELISQSITDCGFEVNHSVKTVVIKPNLCYYWGPSTGNTTDPKLVSAVIDYVRQKYGDVDIKIAEADASAMRTKYAFPVLGYSQLAAEKKVDLVNLSEVEAEEKKVTINGQELTLKIPQILVKSDLFINMPKLKTMKATTITCAMKNLFGANAIPRKVRYHKHLPEAIIGMNKSLRPHLTIVDGIVALGTHPIRLNLIITGTDSFSVDWVAAQVMGFSPAKIEFLKLAVKEQMGSPKNIVLNGEKPEMYSKIFPKQPAISMKSLMKMQFVLLKIYKKVSGDIVPPALEE
jgi:uncharacterized protein (DUF362 family)